MQIHGFNKTTLLDYPEHVAATVFTGGCNFRCPFCHNGELVLDPGCQPLIPEEEVLSYLKKRQGILQGVWSIPLSWIPTGICRGYCGNCCRRN